MSHEHRDDHELAQPAVEEPAPVVVAAPASAVSNSEAERRAAERRKAEGATQQTMQHQFTGDLPEPDRGGGSETETRFVVGDADVPDEAAPGMPAAASRRGPPPPRTHHVEDERSWAMPPQLDALSAGVLAITRSWIRPRSGE